MMADSKVTAQEREIAEKEWKKIQEEPGYYEENYVDVTDDFLPGEVDSLLADLQLGRISREEFLNQYENLSSDHKHLFLKHLPDCFPPSKRKLA